MFVKNDHLHEITVVDVFFSFLRLRALSQFR